MTGKTNPDRRLRNPDSEFSRRELKTALGEKARDLGFQLFGIAPAEPLEADLERFLAWLERGDAARTAAYLGRKPEDRVNPAAALAGARSVVMVGMSYAQRPPDPAAAAGRPEGRVARFALGRDYHDVLRSRLRRLALWLDRREAPGDRKAPRRENPPPPVPGDRDPRGAAPSSPRSRVFVDTGPLLERAFARRAGLGFIGKNNCLIHPRHGSWFVLGALATVHSLPPDTPLECRCGDCRLCLEACPSGALYGEFRLDARRCLSYLTIETRGAIAPEAAASMGNRLFGCDACQEACPFNDSPLECSEPLLRADPSGTLTLETILGIDSNRQFKRLTAGRALARARRKGLRRNAEIVAKNLGRLDLPDAGKTYEKPAGKL